MRQATVCRMNGVKKTMISAGILTLVAESPEARGVLEEATRTTRKVTVTERGLSLAMRAEAHSMGLAPELKLRLDHGYEYHGEALAIYKGVEYSVEHAQPVEKTDEMDLLLKKVDGNAKGTVVTANV